MPNAYYAKHMFICATINLLKLLNIKWEFY